MKKTIRRILTALTALLIAVQTALPAMAADEPAQTDKAAAETVTEETAVSKQINETETPDDKAESDKEAAADDTEKSDDTEKAGDTEKADDTEKTDDTEESENTAKNDDPEALPPENTGRVIFMLYHDIAPGDTLRETDIPEWCTTEEKLSEDIETLYALGFESLSCAKYYAGDYDKTKDYFVLTFDDGYLSNYTILPSVLEKTGTYADIFMCTEMTLLDNHFKYSDAKEMEAGGLIKVYSHFNRHEYINELSRGELKRELKLSLGYLNKRIGGERDLFFAYPHSSYSEETIKYLKDELGITLQFVQFLPPSSYSIDWRDYGITLRATVGYESDIEALVDEYFTLLNKGN